MKIICTLDYELYLGAETGSVERCLIEPMWALTSLTDKYGLRYTVFADASYLCVLEEYADRFPALERDYLRVASHLRTLADQGHDIQLHIHPHWFYSRFDGTKWQMDHGHYKLSDLTPAEAHEVFRRSKQALDRITGQTSTVFRAGGFSAQPSALLTELFDTYGIRADSSVYTGNRYDSPNQQYDYRIAPRKAAYRFDGDICTEAPEGRFLEIPISVRRVSPLFYWRLVFNKLFASDDHKPFGDGVSVKTSERSIVERLTRPSLGFATIDGFKISYLTRAAERAAVSGADYFCIIGHPKLLTPYSARMLDRFCAAMVKQGHTFATIGELL